MRKGDMIIGLARSGLSAGEIAARLGTTVNSVKVVCSRARSVGIDIPYERERRGRLRDRAVVTLSERQVERIEQSTGLTPQQFIEAALAGLVTPRARDAIAARPALAEPKRKAQGAAA